MSRSSMSSLGPIIILAAKDLAHSLIFQSLSTTHFTVIVPTAELNYPLYPFLTSSKLLFLIPVETRDNKIMKKIMKTESQSLSIGVHS